MERAIKKCDNPSAIIKMQLNLIKWHYFNEKISMYVEQGQCLIINQKNYASNQDGTRRERKGTEEDEES